MQPHPASPSHALQLLTLEEPSAVLLLRLEEQPRAAEPRQGLVGTGEVGGSEGEGEGRQTRGLARPPPSSPDLPSGGEPPPP